MSIELARTVAEEQVKILALQKVVGVLLEAASAEQREKVDEVMAEMEQELRLLSDSKPDGIDQARLLRGAAYVADLGRKARR